jgi:hypothetical protein
MTVPVASGANALAFETTPVRRLAYDFSSRVSGPFLEPREASPEVASTLHAGASPPHRQAFARPRVLESLRSVWKPGALRLARSSLCLRAARVSMSSRGSGCTLFSGATSRCLLCEVQCPSRQRVEVGTRRRATRLGPSSFCLPWCRSSSAGTPTRRRRLASLLRQLVPLRHRQRQPWGQSASQRAARVSCVSGVHVSAHVTRPAAQAKCARPGGLVSRRSWQHQPLRRRLRGPRHHPLQRLGSPAVRLQSLRQHPRSLARAWRSCHRLASC